MIKVNHPEVGRLSRTQPRRESFEAENLPQLRSEPKGEVTKRKDRRATTSLALETEGGPGFLCSLQRTALGEIHIHLEKSPFTKTSSSHVIYKDKSSIFFFEKEKLGFKPFTLSFRLIPYTENSIVTIFCNI